MAMCMKDEELRTIAAATTIILASEKQKCVWTREWILQHLLFRAYATRVQEICVENPHSYNLFSIKLSAVWKNRYDGKIPSCMTRRALLTGCLWVGQLARIERIEANSVWTIRWTEKYRWASETYRYRQTIEWMDRCRLYRIVPFRASCTGWIRCNDNQWPWPLSLVWLNSWAKYVICALNINRENVSIKIYQGPHMMDRRWIAQKTDSFFLS